MIKKLGCALLFSIILVHQAFAGEPVLIDDPAKSSEEILKDLTQSHVQNAAKMLALYVAKPEVEALVTSQLKFMNGKVVQYSKKVIDKDYNGALRQIIYYSYIKDVGFVYFLFNFKQTGTGWIMSNFLFQTESHDLFPPIFKNEY